ncbi:MAG: hypothetical protein ACD_46C00632G0002 [uncultured bacterium]|nr:MAG: hypothetical protein ACD_46C00632G0002 [uncultured bacterium]
MSINRSPDIISSGSYQEFSRSEIEGMEEIILENEKNIVPDVKISKNKNYSISQNGSITLFKPALSFIRHINNTDKKVEYLALKKVNPGKQDNQPCGCFGFIKKSPFNFSLSNNQISQSTYCYAEKIFHPKHSYGEDFMTDVIHESQCLNLYFGNLPEPVFIYDKDNHPIKAYLPMPFINGISLDNYLKNNLIDLDDEESFKKTLTICLNLIKQVRLCFNKNIAHRDIKLANAIIDPKTLEVILVDFGLSWLPIELEKEFYLNYFHKPVPNYMLDIKARLGGDIYDLGHTFTNIFFNKKYCSNTNTANETISFALDEIDSLISTMLMTDKTQEQDIDKILSQFEEIYNTFNRKHIHTII